MTKQPRVIVGVDMYSYGGQRNENVFAAAEKFLKRCAERELSKRSNLQVSNASQLKFIALILMVFIEYSC